MNVCDMTWKFRSTNVTCKNLLTHFRKISLNESIWGRIAEQEYSSKNLFVAHPPVTVVYRFFKILKAKLSMKGKSYSIIE